jgi:hypothetical protein
LRIYFVLDRGAVYLYPSEMIGSRPRSIWEIPVVYA